MRSKSEFKQYVFEKSREKIAVRKKRRNIIISSAAAFAVIMGAFAAFNASDLKTPAQSDTAGTTNTQMPDNAVSQYAYNNIMGETEDVESPETEAGNNIEKYKFENDGSASKPEEQLFSDEFENSYDKYELPDYITISSGCIVLAIIDSPEKIAEICSVTKNLIENNTSDGTSAETEISIHFQYNDSDKKNTSAVISGNKLYIDEKFQCYVTDDYLNLIDKCCQNTQTQNTSIVVCQ